LTEFCRIIEVAEVKVMMFLSLASEFFIYCFGVTGLSDLRAPDLGAQELPIMTARQLAHRPLNGQSKQAWLETLSSVDDKKLGIVDLHSDIFATFPR
jgi:hypothetical protein